MFSERPPEPGGEIHLAVDASAWHRRRRRCSCLACVCEPRRVTSERGANPPRRQRRRVGVDTLSCVCAFAGASAMRLRSRVQTHGQTRARYVPASTQVRACVAVSRSAQPAARARARALRSMNPEGAPATGASRGEYGLRRQSLRFTVRKRTPSEGGGGEVERRVPAVSFCVPKRPAPSPLYPLLSRFLPRIPPTCPRLVV